MQTLARHIATKPMGGQVLKWGKLVAVTGSAQVLIQALALVGGIMVVRLLPPPEYALYTLANTMLGTMIVLADGGILAGIMSQGGKVWQDREKLGVVLVTGQELQRKFALFSLLAASPLLVYLLRHHGASWAMSLALSAALIPAFLASLTGSLLGMAPILHQAVVPVQKSQIHGSLGRLVLLASTLFIFPLAFPAVLAAGIPQLWANQKLRRIAADYADWQQPASPVIRRQMLGFVRRFMPGAIYHCLSAQITIWLVSLFGSTASVAQLGALGRLVMVLGAVGSLFNLLILPRFARLPDSAGVLRGRYGQIQAGLLLLSGGVIGLVALFPAQVLWILGPDYAAMRTEVVLITINGCLRLIMGASFSMSISRGWVINPVIYIPCTIGTTILGVVLFDVSSLRGVLLMNILVSALEMLMYTGYNVLKIRQASQPKGVVAE